MTFLPLVAAPPRRLHVGLGVFALGWPWLLPSPAWAAVVGAALLAVPFTLRGAKPSPLPTLERDLRGEIYAVAALVMLFWTAWRRGDPLLYLLPVLVPTLAEALALLLPRAGPAPVRGGAIFAAGFLALWAGIGFAQRLPPLEAGWIAWAAACFATLVAGAARNETGNEAGDEGRDEGGLGRLLVPLALFVMLDGFFRFAAMHTLPAGPASALVLSGLLLGAIALTGDAATRRPALMTAAIGGYALFVVGGAYVMLAGLVAFAGHAWLRAAGPMPARGEVLARLLLPAMVAGGGWSGWVRAPHFAMVAALALGLAIAWLAARADTAPRLRLILGAVAASGLVALPFLVGALGARLYPIPHLLLAAVLLLDTAALAALLWIGRGRRTSPLLAEALALLPPVIFLELALAQTGR